MKVIFASSPPSSMTTSVSGSCRSTAAVAATTSCTNGTPIQPAQAMPAEPVICTLAGASPNCSAISEKSACMPPRTSDMCRR